MRNAILYSWKVDKENCSGLILMIISYVHTDYSQHTISTENYNSRVDQQEGWKLKAYLQPSELAQSIKHTVIDYRQLVVG